MATLAALLVVWPNAALARGDEPASGSVAGRIFTVAGALRWGGPPDESRLATAASFDAGAVAVMPGGGYLVADDSNDEILRVGPNGRVSVVLGGPHETRPLATMPSLDEPEGIAALPRGGFLVSDTFNDRVLKVSPRGHISTVAGNGQEGFGGDGGAATRAELDFPAGLAVMPHGGFLIADSDNNRVRRVWPNGRISTVAGNGHDRFSGDGRRATRAALGSPQGVAALPAGGFLIADTYNNRVREVRPDGRISTVAGNGADDSSRDGDTATSTAIGFVQSVAPVRGGGFLLAGDDVQRVWRDGEISTVVGYAGSLAGDGGLASAAHLYGDSVATVAALPDGGALIGYGNTVRLVVGPDGTRILAAAIRPLRGVATGHAYSARIVLTHAARITLRVFGSQDGRALATARANRPAGESTLTIRLGRRITPGLYALDLRAQSGARTTRAEQYVYLGDTVTQRSIHSVISALVSDEYSYDPNAVINVGKCHRFGLFRADCTVWGDANYVEAAWLTGNGQLRSRTYRLSRGGKKPFHLHPHWIGPAIWNDLGAAWNPGEYGY
jgi:hypothetical protein